MANVKRLADNVASHAARRPGAPRRGLALLQGIAVCGRCARRMGLRYSGPLGDYPVYHCTADRLRDGSSLCQEVRALAVDVEVERLLLEALAPDQLALAVAGVSQLEEEARVLEQQWALKRERARYEAERARRQYDAVEPENRLVARSLERVWETSLRRIEAVEQAYEAWQREQGAALDERDRCDLLALAQDQPRVWRMATAQERKCIVRLVVREVVLDQKREAGMVFVRIAWQTGAVSEHRLQRRVQSYADCACTELLMRRIRELNAAGKMDHEIAAVINAEGLMSPRDVALQHGTVYLLRKRWGIRTAKINGVEANPPRWPDGSYSIQGAAAALGMTKQTVFDWLGKGRLQGRQSTKGQPWQIALTDEQIRQLRVQVRHTNRSKKEAL